MPGSIVDFLESIKSSYERFGHTANIG